MNAVQTSNNKRFQLELKTLGGYVRTEGGRGKNWGHENACHSYNAGTEHAGQGFRRSVGVSQG